MKEAIQMADRRYYTEGSSARKVNYDSRPSGRRPANAARPARQRVNMGTAAPAVRPETPVRPAKRSRRGASHLTSDERAVLAQRRAERRAEVNAQIRYTAGIAAAVVVAVALCCCLLKLTSDVKAAKEEVASLKTQLANQLDENSSYSAGLDSMTDLDEIYTKATTELGMVYSQPEQTLYYSQNDDDYVVQYKDVPDAN